MDDRVWYESGVWPEVNNNLKTYIKIIPCKNSHIKIKKTYENIPGSSEIKLYYSILNGFNHFLNLQETQPISIKTVEWISFTVSWWNICHPHARCWFMLLAYYMLHALLHVSGASCFIFMFHVSCFLLHVSCFLCFKGSESL